MAPTPTTNPTLGADHVENGDGERAKDITIPPRGPRRHAVVGVDFDVDLPRLVLIRLTQKEIDRYSHPHQHQIIIQSKVSVYKETEMDVDSDSDVDNPIKKKDSDLLHNFQTKINNVDVGEGDRNWGGNGRVLLSSPSITTTTTPWCEYDCNNEEAEEEVVTVKIEQEDWDYDAYEMDRYVYDYDSPRLDATVTTSTFISSSIQKRKYRKRKKNVSYKRHKTKFRYPSTPTVRSGKRPKKILTVQEILNHPHHSQNLNIQEVMVMSNQNPSSDPHDDSDCKSKPVTQNPKPQPNHDDGFTPRLRQRKLKPQQLQEPKPSDLVKKCHPIAIEMDVVEKLDIDSFPGPPFNCPLPNCTDTFQSREHLRTHVHVKHVVSQCPVCQGQFRNIVMRQHIYSWHRGYFKQNKHMFPTCVQDSDTSQIRKGTRPSRYEVIDEQEIEKLDLHSLLVPPFKCPIPNCVLEFKSVRSLRSHLYEKHVRNTCPVCKGLFRNVKQHVLRRHPEEKLDLLFPPPQQMAIERQYYTCHISFKTFTRRTTLKRHIETHDPIRKYGCLRCEKTFQTKLACSNHMRYRHPRSLTELEKCPHPLCDQAFQNLGQLRNHERRQHPKSWEGIWPIMTQEQPARDVIVFETDIEPLIIEID